MLVILVLAVTAVLAASSIVIVTNTGKQSILSDAELKARYAARSAINSTIYLIKSGQTDVLPTTIGLTKTGTTQLTGDGYIADTTISIIKQSANEYKITARAHVGEYYDTAVASIALDYTQDAIFDTVIYSEGTIKMNGNFYIQAYNSGDDITVAAGGNITQNGNFYVDGEIIPYKPFDYALVYPPTSATSVTRTVTQTKDNYIFSQSGRYTAYDYSKKPAIFQTGTSTDPNADNDLRLYFPNSYSKALKFYSDSTVTGYGNVYIYCYNLDFKGNNGVFGASSLNLPRIYFILLRDEPSYVDYDDLVLNGNITIWAYFYAPQNSQLKINGNAWIYGAVIFSDTIDLTGNFWFYYIKPDDFLPNPDVGMSGTLRVTEIWEQ